MHVVQKNLILLVKVAVMQCEIPATFGDSVVFLYHNLAGRNRASKFDPVSLYLDASLSTAFVQNLLPRHEKL
jgi:hypothetical protein